MSPFMGMFSMNQPPQPSSSSAIQEQSQQPPIGGEGPSASRTDARPPVGGSINGGNGAASTGAAGLGLAPSDLRVGRNDSISSPPTAATGASRGMGGTGVGALTSAKPSSVAMVGSSGYASSGAHSHGVASSTASSAPMVGKIAGMEPLPDVDMQLDWER